MAVSSSAHLLALCSGDRSVCSHFSTSCTENPFGRFFCRKRCSGREEARQAREVAVRGIRGRGGRTRRGQPEVGRGREGGERARERERGSVQGWKRTEEERAGEGERERGRVRQTEGGRGRRRRREDERQARMTLMISMVCKIHPGCIATCL